MRCPPLLAHALIAISFAAQALGGTFSVASLSGDADSGVVAKSTFTHAFNVGDTGNVKLNGAIFTGIGTTANPSTNNFSTTGLSNLFTGFGSPLTGTVGSLMSNFLYNGIPATVTLRNLRVGQDYETVFYDAAYGGAGGRVNTITTSDGASIVYDENGLPGSRLVYSFTATSPTLTFTMAPQSAGTFHHYAFSNRLVVGEALLTDNFYAPSNPSTSDLNFNLAARQGGLLLPTIGTISWVRSNDAQVGNTSNPVDGGNYLRTASGTGVAALNHNFNAADSAGGLLIAFDLAPDITAAGAGNSSAISLGQAAVDQSGSVSGTQTHFGVRFRGSTGTLQAFDGATVLTATEPSWGSAGVTSQLHHFEIVITDSVDGNPFDGTGETRIEIFADGLSRYTYTRPAGYVDNYINFQSSQVGGVDNLVIARLNTTPVAPSFVTQPQPQTLWRGDVLTLTAAVTGYPSPTFQWYRDGAPISGATGSTYTLTDATGAGGVYTVVATNSQGPTTSNPAPVSVITPTRAQRTWEGAGPSSRRTGLAISEIHYHPPARVDGKNFEFVELYNSNPWIEDLAGYQLTGDASYTFPAGAQIVAKGYLVLAKVPVDLQAQYGITGVLGPYSGNLDNAGGTLRLIKPSGAIVLEVQWNDHAPWPVAADGTGHSIVLARPSYGEASPFAWDASAAIGGSPGQGDLPPGAPQDHVVINEILARPLSTGSDFIELRNDSPDPVDISGCTLSDNPDTLVKYTIPAGTILPARGVISFSSSQSGLGLTAGGEAVYLTNATGTRVLDCVRFPGSATGVSLGRINDREGPLRPLASPTPGAANSGLRTPEVLISEIYFDPITGDDLDTWVEIYNPGAAAVDVSGWKFVDGIAFTFPAGRSVAPGGRLVIAKNAARTRANHPQTDPASIVGDFAGGLGHGGDRLTLSRPDMSGNTAIEVEVDSVTYIKAGRWSRWAAGGGSSLEVRDLHADRSLPSTWADSDESAKSAWTTIGTSGPLDLGHSALTGADRIQVMLMGEGESLVDDVAAVPAGGANVVTNGGFESGAAGWTIQGTQTRSSVVTGTGFTGAALQVRSSGRGDPDGNRIFSALTSVLAPNSTGSISAHARWLRGDPELMLRLRGGYLETVAALPVPPNLGTPGAPNSRALTNAGPAISEVSHRPLLPAAGVPIRVFAAISDPDGIGSATLRWRPETSGSFASVVMHDDGTTGDLLAGDGIFTGIIPAAQAGTLIVFQVEASDAAGAPAASVFPPDAPAHECLVRIGDPIQGGDFAAYRMWMTAANVANWAGRARFGNEPVDATFIYGGVRAVYGCGAWYKGSEASTPGYDSPVGGLCGYHLAPPEDDLVLAENNFTIDWPVRDTTDQREQLMFWMAEQLHLPNLYRRYIHLFINGTRRGTIYDDVQEPGSTLVQQYFPADNNGHLYKTNNWTEGADNGSSTSAGESNILKHYNSGGQHKLARYEWNWRPRASNSATEFNDIFNLVDAVNATTNYQTAVESSVDIENWMRTFAFHDLCSYWDAFGNPNHKNTYLYKPVSGRWTQFTWDMDVGLGVFNDPTNAELFPVTVDPKVDALQAFPAFRRIYWRTIQEAFNTFFSTAGVTPILQRKYTALAANYPGIVSPFVVSGAYGLSVPGFIDQRRAFIQSQLSGVAASFALTSPTSVTVTTPSATITGTAPVTVAFLTVNGTELPVIWNSVTAWSINVVPASGTHPYVVTALDGNGVQVGTATVTITFTGTNAWPALRINEWMASNGGSTPDPADAAPDDWLELFNPTGAAVSLTGWRISDSSPTPTEYIFPSGYSIPANAPLLAWCDAQPAQSVLPSSPHLPFKLSASGETLTLTAPDGTVIDTVTFGPQVTDVSQGRVPDGGAAIDFLAQPSAGTANGGALAPPIASIAAAPAAGTLLITIGTTPGFSYQLQGKADFSSALWDPIGAPVTASGSTLLFSQPLTGTQHFFRALRTP